MQIKKNISLKFYNTFDVDVIAKNFVEINSKSALMQFLSNDDFSSVKKLFLGGGSNILFTKDFDGVVVKLNTSEIKIVSETDDIVYIRAEAGVEWDSLVEYSVNKGLNGIENLSYIPGTVGAAPIQNIGAYGVEVKDIIESVDVILLDDLEERTLINADCIFGYRNSIFKNELKNKFIITSVLFKLSKKGNLNFEYFPLKEFFSGKENITSQDVRSAVISIRKSKLPEPSKLGNAGSFFKNPIISKEKFDNLETKYNDLNGYPEANLRVKISAGWLIEKCELKGKRIGNVGVHEKQALVIVNYGNATGDEIVEFSKMIERKVEEKFGVKIINEVNII